MSYAEQIGDKFYWMNPPDAQEGDECIQKGEWEKCYAYTHKPIPCSLIRRRLIAPGEGWRILAPGDAFQQDIQYQSTKDGIIWWNCYPVVETLNYFIQYNPDIIAIRQRIPVESGKDNEWPRYWEVNANGPFPGVVRMMLKNGLHEYYSIYKQWVLLPFPFDAFCPSGVNRITPAEAQARM